MANNVKYLSLEGLRHFWQDKLKPEIDDNEEVVAIALTNLDDRLKSHSHSYVASAGYSASAAKATSAASAGYSASAARATYAASAAYSGSAGYSASAARATSAASAGYSASAARATSAASAGYSVTAANSVTAGNSIYSASAGYSASAARATYAASSGYAATAANSVTAANSLYSGSAGYIATAANAVTAGRALYSGSAGYSASAARATSAASAGYAALANQVANNLTIQVNGTTLTNGVYDGSAAKTVNITAESLGLTKVFDYKGLTTSNLSDGSTTKPILIGGSNYTQKIGDVVIVNNDSDKEYFWNGNFWEELGRTIDLSGYLPLSGGTMTGIITSQSIIPAKNHTSSITGYNLGSSSTQFNTTYTRFVDTVSGYNLRLKAGGVEHINMLSGNVNITANIIPTKNNTYSLGSTTTQWKNAYATTFTGNLSGLIKSMTLSTEDAYTLNVNNALRFDSQIPSKTIGGTTWGSGYNNAILTIGRITDDNYVSQLGFTGSGLWYRAFSNEAANTTKPFNKVVLENGNKWNIVANTANALTNVNSLIQNAQARDLTLFPKSMTLFTNGWNTSTGNFSTTWGTTLDISYSTYYQRLAFNTTGRIEYFRGINSNNSDNTSASLTKVGDLAYLSDIPTAAVNIGAAAESHEHAAVDITSGTLSVSRGGTGLSTITTGHVIIGNGTGKPTTANIISITNAEIDNIF